FRQDGYDPLWNIISVKDENGNLKNINTDTDFNHAYTYAGYRYDQESVFIFPERKVLPCRNWQVLGEG
nr:hypothetical protein [Desulfitobacterium hafniense]